VLILDRIVPEPLLELEHIAVGMGRKAWVGVEHTVALGRIAVVGHIVAWVEGIGVVGMVVHNVRAWALGLLRHNGHTWAHYCRCSSHTKDNF